MSLFAIAVIKELAPVKGAETDKILGVGEFQTKYFLDYPVYLDPNKAFYAALGKSGVARLLSILLHLIHQMCCFSEELKSFSSDHLIPWTGNKSLLAQPLSTWNPFRLYAAYKEMTARMKRSVITTSSMISLIDSLSILNLWTFPLQMRDILLVYRNVRKEVWLSLLILFYLPLLSLIVRFSISYTE